MTRLRVPIVRRAGLHRDERGFLSPLIIFMLVALAYMIVWILDTGQMIYDKQRTQDTADAAALVHADWEARSLNIMAMNNVAASQATVILATSVAYSATLAELLARSTYIGTRLTHFVTTEGLGDPVIPIMPIGSPYCETWGHIPLVGGIIEAACDAFQLLRGFAAAKAVVDVGIATAKYNPPGLIAKSLEIIRAMNKLNDYLVESFPERVSREALHLVRLDDADHVVFHPACTDAAKPCREAQGGDLPVERDVLAFHEMCHAMEHGTEGASLGPFSLVSHGEYAKRGFPIGKGPFSAGGKDGRPIRDFVNDESGLSSQLPFWHGWYETFGPGYMTGLPTEDTLKNLIGDKKVTIPIINVDIDPVGAAMDFGKLFKMGGFVNPFQYPLYESDAPPERYTKNQTREENDFTRKFDTVWDGVCGAGGVGGTMMSMITVLPTPYSLKGRKSAASAAAAEIGADGVATRTTGDQKTDYRVLAVVSRQPRARLQVNRFVDKTPSAYATAEGWVHNYTSFDLYTQDWLATLAPTSLMNDAQALAVTIRKSPAAASYKTLTRAFDNAGSNGWASINAH